MTDLELPSVDADPPLSSLEVSNNVSSLAASTGTLTCLPAVDDLDSASHAASVPFGNLLRVLKVSCRGKPSGCRLLMTVYPAQTVSWRPHKDRCRFAALAGHGALHDPRWPRWVQSARIEHEMMLTDL